MDATPRRLRAFPDRPLALAALAAALAACALALAASAADRRRDSCFAKREQAALRSPRPFAAFFGRVAATAPRGATRAALFVDGRRAAAGRVRACRVVFRLRRPPGRYDVRVRFQRRGDLPVAVEARRVWLLARSAARGRRERATDARLAARLARLGRGFDGWAGLWTHDLATGRTAGWNSDAPFPAASTVKLAVLVAALDRFGARPGSPAWRDIRDLALWSSNLATNRLLLRLGGSEAGGARAAQAVLWRLGARSSTFTGFYRLGTAAARPRADAPRPLPLLASRRTTARDLGRVLLELHLAALGNRLSQRRTRLTPDEARVALGLLLASDARGDNVGLFRPALGRRFPLAQKHGWTESVRHSAAIVYTTRGPRVAVLLTYRPGLRPAAARILGRRFLRALALEESRRDDGRPRARPATRLRPRAAARSARRRRTARSGPG